MIRSFSDKGGLEKQSHANPEFHEVGTCDVVAAAASSANASDVGAGGVVGYDEGSSVGDTGIGVGDKLAAHTQWVTGAAGRDEQGREMSFSRGLLTSARS